MTLIMLFTLRVCEKLPGKTGWAQKKEDIECLPYNILKIN
jgi:hypothetical protein